MYATESSTRGGDEGPATLDLTADDTHEGNPPASSAELPWAGRVEGEDEGGRGGETTVESPFKDPNQLQPAPAQAITRLPSFATLTYPLNRNGSPATPTAPTTLNAHPDGPPASPAAVGAANAQAGPSQSSPTGSSFSGTNTAHFSSAAAAQQIAQSSNYGNYYAEVDHHDAANRTGHDPSLLIDPSGLGPYDDHAAAAELGLSLLNSAMASEHDDGGGLNPSVKRAREDDDREGSTGSNRASGSPNPTKPITTQKTRDAGMTRRKTEARFTCPVEGCGSTFTRSHNLSGHLRSHADERPFKCDVCGRGFARQHDCKRHARLHVPEQASSFECQGCNKKFARSDGLAQHQMRTDVGKECLRASGVTPAGTSADPPAPTHLNFRLTSPEPWSNIEHEDGPPLTVEEEKAVLEAAVLEYVRIYPSTLPGSSRMEIANVLFPFPQGLTPPELLVWISHSPFPEMAKDQEVLRLFGKLIGLPSHPRPESVLAPEAETFDVNGLVLDPALMALEQAASGQGAPSSAEPVVVKQNMRCDFVHPISKQRCPKVFTRSFDMRRHFDSVHNVKITSGHQCEDCEKRFSRSDALGRHKRSYCLKRHELGAGSYHGDDVNNLQNFAASAHQNQDFPQYQPYQSGPEMDYPDGL